MITGRSLTSRASAGIVQVKVESPTAPSHVPTLATGGAAASVNPAGSTSVTVAAACASDGPVLRTDSWYSIGSPPATAEPAPVLTSSRFTTAVTTVGWS